MHLWKMSMRRIFATAIFLAVLFGLGLSLFWPDLSIEQKMMLTVGFGALLIFQLMTALWIRQEVTGHLVERSSPVTLAPEPGDQRRRFLVKQGQRWLSLEIAEIAWFHAEGKLCYLKTWDNHRYFLEYTLEELKDMLPHPLFFRINRAYIVHIKAIKGINPYFNGKLILQLQPETEDKEVLVSKEKAVEFKKWLGK